MTLKDIAKQLTTAVQTVPNLVQILRDGLEQATAGSTVEVTQVVSSGTKIASVTVDDETTDLYAPSAEIIYSTTERIVGKWIDNSIIYEKTINLGTMPNNDSVSVDLNISNIGTVVYINCIGIASTSSIPVPYVDDTYKNSDVLFDINTSLGTARMITKSDKSVFTAYLTMRYTKAEN